MGNTVKRGNIWWAHLPDSGRSSVQSGVRPVLIVSNEAANTYSPVVSVVPLTSSLKKKRLPTHVEFTCAALNAKSIALCEQILSLDKSELMNRAGFAPEWVMRKVDNAMRIQLSLV